MTGGFDFKLVSKRSCYEFTVNRKIMRITGDSANGKTDLIDRVSLAQLKNTGVTINCKYPCRVLTDDLFYAIKQSVISLNRQFKNHKTAAYKQEARKLFTGYDNMLFFADEDFSACESDEFAVFCQYTDSFFVLVRRDYLVNLPYSYSEIYIIRTSGKYHFLDRKYHEHSFKVLSDSVQDLYLTEDSNSGFGFFKRFFDYVYTANGKSGIVRMLHTLGTERHINIIGDGAAFGCEIERVMLELEKKGYDADLFLPESFEYLLLTSEIFDDTIRTEAKNVGLNATGLDFSWERFFTEFISNHTKNFHNAYSKNALNKCYYEDCCYGQGGNCNLNRIVDKKEAVLGKYFHNRQK